MTRKVVGQHILALAAYTVLTVILTYPTAFRLTTHIPGFGDAPWFLWDLWWFKHAILDLHRSPFVTNFIYYPLQDVPVTWQTPVNEFLMAPFVSVAGVVVLYNVLCLASFVLSGYFTYLLGLAIVRQRAAAFIAGLIFAFCAYRGMRLLGHLSLLTTQWMPLALLLLLTCWRRPTISRGIAAGVGVTLAALSSPYYVFYFLLPVFLVGISCGFVWRRLLWRRELLRAGLAAVLVTSVVCSLFYASLLRVDSEMQAVVQQLSKTVYHSPADLLAWLLPAALHPLWGRYTRAIYALFTNSNLTEATVFFGLIPLILAGGSLSLRSKAKRQAVFWQLLALVAFLVALGPVLYVAGQPVLGWMPYRLFMLLPGAEAVRVPSRASITTVLACSILTAIVLTHMTRTYPRWPWSAIILIGAGVLLFNNIAIFPFPSSSAAIPSVYQRIAEDPGDFAILELPAGEERYAHMSWYMYYQTYHGKRLVSGYLGRRPARLHAQERTIPFIRRFFTGSAGRPVELPDEQAFSAGQWPRDIRLADALLADLNVRYVVLHCEDLRGSFCRPAAMLLNQALGLPAHWQDGTLLYNVVPPRFSSARGDFAA